MLTADGQPYCSSKLFTFKTDRHNLWPLNWLTLHGDCLIGSNQSIARDALSFNKTQNGHRTRLNTTQMSGSELKVQISYPLMAHMKSKAN